MDQRTLAAVALSSEDFPSFDAKLERAAEWISLAASSGAELIALPEAINLYKGDGDGNPEALRIEDVAMEDWRAATKVLIDAAIEHRVAVTVPLFVRESGRLFNVFHLVGEDGGLLGTYRKMYPTRGEIEEGVCPDDDPQLIEWKGLKIGGAICFDTQFADVFERQADAGADLFLIPSLWPGGSQLEHVAREYATPIVLAYPAWSRIIDITGWELAATGYRNETLRFGFGTPIITATINFDRVALHAGWNQALMVEVQRAYGERIGMIYDQPNCTYYLESRDVNLTVREVMDEFGLTDRRTELQADGALRHEALRKTAGV